MANYRKLIQSIIKESIEEDTEYQRFFKATLNRFGADSPDDLDDETKKKFFNFIDSNWDVVDEARRKRNKLKPGDMDFDNDDYAQDWYDSDLEDSVQMDEQTRAYIKFLNKDKGHREDIKYFTGKDWHDANKKATKWAKKNFEKFHPDMIHFEGVVNEKIQDFKKGDTAHVSKENKTGMVLKQYGTKVHLKFPNGKEKTYNHDELRKIHDDNVNEEFRSGTASAYNSKIQKWGKRYGIDVDWKFKEGRGGKTKSYFVFDMTFDKYSEGIPSEARDRLHALNKAYGVDFAYRNRNWTPIVESSKLVSESSYPHTDKIEALNDFFNGKISADELKSMAYDVFGRPVATKKQLQDFVNNKFLQGVMADSYDISPSQLVKKVKELLNKKVYEGIVTENEIPIEKVKVGDTVSNPTGKGNTRTDPPIFTVSKIEKKKGSRGDEIVLLGKDRFGKKQFLIRDKGKPVELRESSVTESKLPLQLERIKDEFVKHIRKHNNVGSIAKPLTDKLDIVMLSPKPHHKDAKKYEHSDPVLFLTIEDMRRKRIVETGVVDFGSFDKTNIEKGVDNAMQELVKLVSKSKINTTESISENKNTKYYIEYEGVDDPFGKTIQSFDTFDKKKIEQVFNGAVKKYLKNEGDEIYFGKDDDKYIGDVLFTVELKNGKPMTQITKGSKTYYRPFRGFK